MTVSEPNDTVSAVVCRAGGDCDDLDLKLSRSWLRIGVAGVFAGQGMVFSLALNMTPPPYGSSAYWALHGLLCFSALVVMGFLGGPLFTSTWGMLRTRQLSIEGLFTLSLAGAFGSSVVGSLTGQGGIFYEIVSIVIAIYTFGRMLGERSQARLKFESARLREDFDQAERMNSGGTVSQVNASEVHVGQMVRIDPGAPFTLDGVVRTGVGFVRETALSGEPLAVVRRPGDLVRAGTYSVDGSFEVEVTGAVGERELDRILDRVESHQGQPSQLQRQANQLVQYFLPLVATVSLLTAAYWAWVGTWIDAVLNSMAVLLVACPCALGLATPVAIWNGLYRMARLGIISRDGALIDGLAHVRKVYFDKTGTLSESEMDVGEMLVAAEWEAHRAELLSAVMAVESRLEHPVARALTRISALAVEKPVAVEAIRWLPGAGVEARVELCGSRRQLRLGEIDGDAAGREKLEEGLILREGKRIYVSVDGRTAALIVLLERARAGLASLWPELESLGVRSAVLTGDPDPKLELPPSVPVKSGLSSEEKATILQAAVESGEAPCFIGDGINDAAAIAQATSSISMGSGTGLTRSAAMGQFYDDRIEALPDAIRLARSIHGRLRMNLIYAFAYNSLGMALAAAGLLHPVVAALIMLVSSGFVTLRVLRS